LQGGFDYMLNKNWGVFVDAKTYLDRSVSKATGLNYGPPLGVIDTAATAVTHVQPWVLATGVTYRF
jgi:outer membrane protein W